MLSLALVIATGCQSETSTGGGHDHGHGHDHDHSHRPSSLHEAVDTLKELRAEIKAAMDGGSPDDAHDALHHVGELLEVLPEVAADTDLPKDKWQEVKDLNKGLFDAFGRIDETFHAGGGDKAAVHQEVSAEIDEAIAKIEALLPLAGEAEHDHDHDHDHEEGHDHDGHDH